MLKNEENSAEKLLKSSYENNTIFIISKTKPDGNQINTQFNISSDISKFNLEDNNLSLESKRVFICHYPDCPKRYKNKSILKKHYNSHFYDIAHVCHFFPCMKTFKSRENLDLHISNAHLMIKPYDCRYCNRVFSHRNGKTYHERTKHLNYFPYGCDVTGCEKKFANRYGLKSHLKVTHK